MEKRKGIGWVMDMNVFFSLSQERVFSFLDSFKWKKYYGSKNFFFSHLFRRRGFFFVKNTLSFEEFIWLGYDMNLLMDVLLEIDI